MSTHTAYATKIRSAVRSRRQLRSRHGKHGHHRMAQKRLFVERLEDRTLLSSVFNGDIAFSSNRDGDFELFRMSPDGTNVRQITSNSTGEIFSAWSPDGTKLAFASYRDGNFDIYAIHADGSGEIRLTTDPATDSYPDWSPDGSRIAFFSNRDGNNEIYVMNADGSQPTRLTFNPAADDSPAWSPDASRIAFRSNRDGNLEIYVMNSDGTNIERLTNDAASEYVPDWSPQGSQITFASTRSGNLDIYVMNHDGTGVTRLTNDPASDTTPRWSPDGTRICFTRGSDVYVMNADGAGVQELTTNGFSPDWQTLYGGTITGFKYEDLNGNGIRDESEPGLVGWTIFLDDNRNGMLDPAESRTLTLYDDLATPSDEAGRFVFADLRPGTYVVREVLASSQTQPGSVIGDGFADFVLEYYDSGKGAIAGPYGGLNDNEAAVPVSLDVVLGGGGTDTSFLSLPEDSYVTLRFVDETLRDGPGNDLLVRETGAADERADVYVSANLIDYVWLGVAADATVTGFDLASIDLGNAATIQAVRIVARDSRGSSPGFDLLNVEVPAASRGSAPGSYTVAVASGEVVSEVDFGNRPAATIIGSKYDDTNGNGVRDEGEPGLVGWTIFLDDNRNGILDSAESWASTLVDDPSTPIDEAGTFSFANLRPGTYVVREVMAGAEVQTQPRAVLGDGFADAVLEYYDSAQGPMPGPYGGLNDRDDIGPVSLDVVLGGGGTDTSFLSLPEDSYVTLRFVDETLLDGPGNDLLIRETGAAEERADVYVSLNLVDYVWLGVAEGATVSGFDLATVGIERTADVQAVRIVARDSFGRSPGFDLVNVEVPATSRGPAPGFHSVNLSWGEVATEVDFGNRFLGAITGDKYEDINGNGYRDTGEPGLSGWTINLDQNGDGSIDATATTDNEGQYAFENLAPGTFVVSEANRDGSGVTTVIPLDPRGTYLRALYNEPMVDPVRLNLSSLGIGPGDTIHLVRRGDFDQGDGFGDARPWLIGVFSSNGVLLDASQQQRIPGAIEAGDDWNTWGLPNDIPQDFFIDDVTIQVPAGATHLFIGMPDSLFSDNRDPDGDFRVEITNLDSGWRQSAPAAGNYTVTLQSGDVAAERDFGNYRPASVAGYKFEDVNGNGLDDAEPRLSGVAFTLTGTDGRGQSIGPTTVYTDMIGEYRFDDLAPGEYTVAETLPAGSFSTTESSVSLSITSGENVGAAGAAGIVLAGPITNPANGHSYYLLNQQTWTAAEADAVALGGHLVTINDAAEQDWVFSTFANYGGTSRNLWLGLNDAAAEGSFTWTSGEPVTFTNWGGGEPNNGGGNEDFALMWGPNTFTPPWASPATAGTWNDLADTDLERSLFNHGVVEVTRATWDTDARLAFGNARSSSIQGYKFEDLNGNGRDDLEPRLSGVEIALTGSDGRGHSVAPRVVFTNANGEYTFDGLWPGEYTVTETVPGGSVASTASTASFSLRSGQFAAAATNAGNVDVWSLSVGGNGHAYEFVPADRILWPDARAAAEARSLLGVPGHLATITSSAENLFVQRLVDSPSITEAWIGSYQPEPNSSLEPAGGWVWITGEPFEFTNWARNEPNNYVNNEHVMGLWGSSGRGGDGRLGEWNDQGVEFIGNISGYLVEYPVRLLVEPKLAFGNYRLASVSGVKFADADRDGSLDDGEHGLVGWTIELVGVDGQGGTVERTATTGDDGEYRFDDLRPGNYVVREVPRLGWRQTEPEAGEYLVTLVSGDVLTRNFGNFEVVTAAVTGQKFNDQDGDGVRDATEPGLDGWTVELYDAQGDFVASTVTAPRDRNGDGAIDSRTEAGWYEFTGLPAGTYEVREVPRAGWQQTWPASGGQTVVVGPETTFTFTTDADFDRGQVRELQHDDPAHDQLQLDFPIEPFPFINVAASGRGTVVRISTETGQIVGEYQTAPDGRGRDPSRTTVDLYGNVWVGNRGEGDYLNGVPHGSVTKIGLVVGGTRGRKEPDGSFVPDPAGEYLQGPFSYSTVTDRDGDGLIRTSSGLGSILAWPDLGDGLGGTDNPRNDARVADAYDEAILVYQRLPNSEVVRHVSVDASNNVWVGGWPGTPRSFHKLDGENGAILTSFDAGQFGAGGYGGFVDEHGVLWSASPNQGRLLRYDPATGVGTAIPVSGSYGMGVDGAGNVWNAMLWNDAVMKVDSAGNIVPGFPKPSGGRGPRGVATTADNHVWVANGWSNSIARLNAAGEVVKSIGVGSEPTGVAVDAAGKVWVTNLHSHDVMRIDPHGGDDGLGAVDLTVDLGWGAYPYNYSDMTGNVVTTRTAPQGTWSVVQDAGGPFAWTAVTWNTESPRSEPFGSSLDVAVRTADARDELASQSFVAVTNAGEFALPGRFIEVRATLKPTSGLTGLSPVLSDLTLSGHPYHDFGNAELISISGTKYEDRDADGTRDDGEPGVSGWTIHLDRNGDGTIETTTVTDEHGDYSFADRLPGNYTVTEAPRDGWRQVAAPAPTAWWTGDGDARDMVGGHDGQFRGDATTGDGLMGGAFVLDGDGDFVNVPHDPAIDFGTGDFTVSVWANFDSLDGEQILIENWIHNTPWSGTGWTFFKNSWWDGIGLHVGPTINERLDAPPFGLQPDTWYQFAATRQGELVTIYVNGMSAASGRFPVHDLDSSASLKIGHRGTIDDTPGTIETRHFDLDGLVDDARLYVGEALSADDIRGLYETGLVGVSPPPATYAIRSTGGEAFTGRDFGNFRLAHVEFSSATYSVGEDAGISRVVTLTRDASLGESVVQVAIVGGTATSGAGPSDDYDATGFPQEVVFGHGESSKSVSLPIFGDAFVEPNETIVLSVVPVRYAVSGPQSMATLTIVDDDVSAVGVTVAAEQVAEDGAAPLVFTFHRDRTSAETPALTVPFVVGGTATGGTDYGAVGEFASFAAGSSVAAVTIVPTADALAEPDETVVVTIAAGTDYTVVGAGTATGTIANDDALPTLALNDVSIAEGHAGSTFATFTVTLSTVSGMPTTVDFATSDGTASAGLDYAAAHGTLAIPAGSAQGTVAVEVFGDTLREADESFFVRLSNAGGATLGDDTGAGTIVDDDLPPTLAVNDTTVLEGNSGTTAFVFTVRLSAASGLPVAVNYATSNGSATNDDYVQTNGRLTFAPGETHLPVTVSVAGDTVREPDETFWLNLSTPAGAWIEDFYGVATIANDDAPPTLSVSDAARLEGDAGAAVLTFVVSLSSPSAELIQVSYATADGTAVAASGDYSPTAGLLYFSPGTSEQTLSVSVIGDRTTEPDETFSVLLSAPSNATLADASGVGTITNDDAVPALSIGDVTLYEGNSGLSLAVFLVTLDRPSASTVTVAYATLDGGASGSPATAPSDYAATGGTLAFSPGQTQQIIRVAVVGELLAEPNETFSVLLSSPTNATVADGTGVATILTEDALPTLAINDVAVTEGNAGTKSATFTVTLSAAAGASVTVAYATANGPAPNGAVSNGTVAGSDYVATSGTLTIPAGTLSGTLGVTLNGDTTDEPNETYYVNLSSPTNATLADSQGLGTITNDDSVLTPTLKRFDFNAAGSPTAAGFAGVAPTQRYDAALGYGYLEVPALGGTTTAADTSMATDDLYRDGHKGFSNAFGGSARFRVKAEPGYESVPYVARLYVGDYSSMRNHIRLRYVQGATTLTSPQATTAGANQFTSVILSGITPVRSSVDGNYYLDLVIEDVSTTFDAASYTWTVNGLDVAVASVGLPPAATLLAGSPLAPREEHCTIDVDLPHDSLGESHLAAAHLVERDGYITDSDLAPVVEHAIALWLSLGLPAEQRALLSDVRFTIADLDAEGHLGLAGSRQIVLDDDGGGRGWWLSPSPTAHDRATDLVLRDRYDLLTVVTHELGHVLGLPDVFDEPSADASDLASVMAAVLHVGERREPTAGSWLAAPVARGADECFAAFAGAARL